MITRRVLPGFFAAFVVLIFITTMVAAQDTKGTSLGTGFTYQGHLKNNNAPYSGLCDFQFGLYDALTAGTRLGLVGFKNVPVTEGYFTVVLDYGIGMFTGESRWLEIEVRCPTAVGNYTLLTPRQPLTAAPYALALPGLWTVPQSIPNLIGGYPGNVIWSGVVGSTIGGGGFPESPNVISDSFNTISGGFGNQAGNSDSIEYFYATIGGGRENFARGNSSTISGGYGNYVSGLASTISGGKYNDATLDYATVSGGYSNESTGIYSTIGGGTTNISSFDYATVGGGYSNQSTGYGSTIGGGYLNTASGALSTIPGGLRNVASGYSSFAAGAHAKAINDGCFVWGDSTVYGDITCSSNDRWVARSSGGVYFYTNYGLTSGMYLASGGSAWNAVSSRDLKENFTLVDTNLLLENIAKHPITSWNYKSQDTSIRHIGLMADEFNALLDGLGGEGMDHINSLDADGVALAAIQGLYTQNQELIQQNEDQTKKIDDLETRIEQLEKMAISENSLQSSIGIPLPWLILFGLFFIVGNLIKNRLPGWRQ